MDLLSSSIPSFRTPELELQMNLRMLNEKDSVLRDCGLETHGRIQRTWFINKTR